MKTRTDFAIRVPRLLAGSWLLISISLAGCGDSIPDCTDSAVKEMVNDFIEDSYDDRPTAIVTGAVLSELTEVRSLGYNERTRVRECAAKVRLTGNATGKATNEDSLDARFQVGPTPDNLGFEVKLLDLR
jgi:hypothetical protein